MAADGSDGGGTGPRSPRDVELSERLQRLGKRLDTIRDANPKRAAGAGSEPVGPSPMGKAFRLSTEFMAGIIAGAGLGWGLDTFAGTRPWGMIVLTILGFGAGIWNVMRSSGFLKPARDPGGNDRGPS